MRILAQRLKPFKSFPAGNSSVHKNAGFGAFNDRGISPAAAGQHRDGDAHASEHTFSNGGNGSNSLVKRDFRAEPAGTQAEGLNGNETAHQLPYGQALHNKSRQFRSQTPARTPISVPGKAFASRPSKRLSAPTGRTRRQLLPISTDAWGGRIRAPWWTPGQRARWPASRQP